MPIPAVLLPSLISAGSSLLGTGASALSQGAQNRKSRRWQEKMYDWQRRDALSDYQMQNQYNHPSSQMARLREAGLNPNLVYGNGATTQGANVRSSDSGSWNPQASEFDFGAAAQQGLAAYMSTDMKEAQLDNLRLANTVKAGEAALIAAQTENTRAQTGRTMIDTQRAGFDFDLQSEIRPQSIEASKLSIGKTLAETNQILTNTEIAAVMKAPNLTKAIEEVLLIRKHQAKTEAEIRHIEEVIKNVKADTGIKQEDLKLKEMGIQPHDPIVRRLVAQKIALQLKSVGRGLNPTGNKWKTSNLSKQGRRLY